MYGGGWTPMLAICFSSSCFLPKTPFAIRTIFSPHLHSFNCKFHPLSIKLFSTQDVFTFNVKISNLSRSGNIGAARQMFDEMTIRDTVSWNSIITGYWQNGCFDESKRLFGLMPAKSVVSWNSMIAGCIESERIDEAWQYFQAMPQRNTASWNAMISGLVRYDRVEEASRLFEEMPRRNVISYTAMVDGFAKIGEIEQARALFNYIPQKNAVSWTVMISGYLENGKFDEAEKLFEQMPDKNIVAMTAMITGYCKEGKTDKAKMVFDQIPCRDRASWNAIITGYAQNGSGEEALKLLSQMLKTGMQPDHATLVSVLTACSSLASLQEGRKAHVLVLKSGYESHTSICNALITMYCKCGSIIDSELAFQQIDHPDVVSWNSLIAAFARHGFYDRALASFDEMRLNRVEPDGITFLSLLSACDHAGKVHESLNWFNSMVESYRIIPGPEHYACLVDILSRRGQVEKAYEIIQEMPFEADSGIWSALLAACHVHLNVKIGELAAKKIMELEPQNSGAYVVLSNIYAAAGMWREVTRVRGLMKEQGVKKQPAYSWMEIANKVHIFSGDDASHPEIHRIRLDLKGMRLQMIADNDIEEVFSEWSS